MKKFRNVFFYISIIGGFSMLMYWIVQKGKVLEVGRNIQVIKEGENQWMEFLGSFIKNFEHPLAILLAQIITIIIVARILGWICSKIGQPTVIGEIIAGIVAALV